MYTAPCTLYLTKAGQATKNKTETVYLVAGACISDAEARRVGLKPAPAVAPVAEVAPVAVPDAKPAKSTRKSPPQAPPQAPPK